MKPIQNTSLSTHVASDDPFAIYAKGIWTLRGDALRLTEKPELVTTSLAVAAVFGKEHSKVLRAIRNMECSEEFSQRNFAPATYLVDTTPQAKIGLRGTENTALQARPMVEMTRKGFDFLVLGFTGKKAAMFREAYVQRFHAMEAELVKKTSEIERLARLPEHMPYLNVLEITGRKAVARRIKNQDFKPIPAVEIAQAARGEGDYFVM